MQDYTPHMTGLHGTIPLFQLLQVVQLFSMLSEDSHPKRAEEGLQAGTRWAGVELHLTKLALGV